MVGLAKWVGQAVGLGWPQLCLYLAKWVGVGEEQPQLVALQGQPQEHR